jgi:hypothetical protein
MPILDHFEKATGVNVTSVTIPFAFAPEALNRGMLVIAMVSHPTNIGYPFGDCSYAGLAVEGQNLGTGAQEPGAPEVRAGSFFRGPRAGEVPLSGDVVLDFVLQRNAVVYAIGLRGVGLTEFGFDYLDKQGQNGTPSGDLNIDLSPNPYLAIAGFAMTPTPVGILSIDDPAIVILDEDSAGSGAGSVDSALFSWPAGVAGNHVALLDGLANWAGVGWSTYAPLPIGAPPSPRVPLSPYILFELFWRRAFGRPK